MPCLTIVTGAAGFAGSHLLDLLRQPGAELVAWHRPGGTEPPAMDGVRWHRVDMLDRESVRDTIRSVRPDHVYHCAGAAHVGQAWDTSTKTLAVNVLGTHHLVEALRDLAPEARVFNPSSALVCHTTPTRRSPGLPPGLRPAS